MTHKEPMKRTLESCDSGYSHRNTHKTMEDVVADIDVCSCPLCSLCSMPLVVTVLDAPCGHCARCPLCSLRPMPLVLTAPDAPCGHCARCPLWSLRPMPLVLTAPDAPRAHFRMIPQPVESVLQEFLSSHG